MKSDLATRTHLITFFDDQYASVKFEEELTLPQLAEEIKTFSDVKKTKLPFLKMARFGEVKSPKNCLRYDANVKEVNGVEIDYDAGKMTFDAAIAAMKGARVRSLLYTSASYVAGSKEKWRVMAPLSEEYSPAKRAEFVAVLNGILGGVAAGESFNLSHAFYYGSVNNNPAHRVEIVDGDFIDERPDLWKNKLFKQDTGKKTQSQAEATPPGVTPGRSEDDIARLLKSSRRKGPGGEGQWHNAMLQAVASMLGKGWTDAQIYAACQDYCDGGWGDKDIAELISSGREKWKTPDPDRVMNQIGPVVAAAIEAKGEPDFEPNWRERYVNGRPKASLHNAILAVEDSQILCREDVFHNKLWMVSHRTNEVLDFMGEVTDARLLGLRVWLSNRYGIDLSEKFVRDAVVELARSNRFNPVVDMLDEAEANWDGIKRLDRLAADYFNCEDTPLNSVCVRKVMIAAVARARRPGIKFDTILVMESPEGWNKSSVWALLAGEGNFSDERIIGHATREVMEQLAGIWIHENADLAGMRKAEVETVKAFASRQVDRARPAYGHFLVEQPRHSIEVGTTNADTYLQSTTGNRRFWPISVLKPIDLDQVKRDRLQLWGEAAHYQSHGESLVLPEELWSDAAIIQESRRAVHPWEERLAELSPVVGHVKVVGDEWRVSTAGLFTYLNISPSDQKRHAKDLAEIMRILGWSSVQIKTNGQVVRGYVKKGSGSTWVASNS